MGLEEAGVLPDAKVSEVVEIQPRPVRITSFTVNGRNAEPKYLIPVDQGQSLPGFRIGWQVEGGSTARVELLPAPGFGRVAGHVAPTPGSHRHHHRHLRVSDGTQSSDSPIGYV